MKNVIKLCLLATIMLLPFSCERDLIETNLGIDGPNTVDFKSDINRSSQSTVPIIEKPGANIMVIPGASSTLHRNKNGITVNFQTKHLIPGNAYTLWWVVLGDAPGPPIFVGNAAGHIAGDSGTGNFSGHLSAGESFTTPLTAEVHLVLRTHGPAQPGMIPEQINNINGGCTSGFPSGPGQHPDSDTIGYCANIQLAVHPKVVN